MIKICFVCLGNICRSPMAEFVLKEKLKNLNLSSKVIVESRATSYEEQGNNMHYGTKEVLSKNNIPYTNHKATRLEKDDYDKFDYFICMDSSNIRNTIRIIGEDQYNKVFRLLDITELKRDVLDPWYTGDFNTTYNDINIGTDKIIELLQNNKL